MIGPQCQQNITMIKIWKFGIIQYQLMILII